MQPSFSDLVKALGFFAKSRVSMHTRFMFRRVHNLTHPERLDPMPAEPTAEQWRHMDGTSAWLTIDMHAVNMEDTGRLMGEWLAANQTEKSPPTLRPVG
jgi:hypothetical protein